MIHFTLQLCIKPEKPQPDSFQDKPGLIAIPHDNNKTISEIPYFLFHIETSYDFDSTIWKSGGYPIPTEAWRTQLDDEISMMEPKTGQKGSKTFLPFKRLEGGFRPSRPDDEVKCSNVPLKFEGGSFELIKSFSNFFHRKFDRKWTKIHIFGSATEDIWVRTTSSCYQLWLFISLSL